MLTLIDYLFAWQGSNTSMIVAAIAVFEQTIKKHVEQIEHTLVISDTLNEQKRNAYTSWVSAACLSLYNSQTPIFEKNISLHLRTHGPTHQETTIFSKRTGNNCPTNNILSCFECLALGFSVFASAVSLWRPSTRRQPPASAWLGGSRLYFNRRCCVDVCFGKVPWSRSQYWKLDILDISYVFSGVGNRVELCWISRISLKLNHLEAVWIDRTKKNGQTKTPNTSPKLHPKNI